CGARDGQMAAMHRIECPAEECNPHFLSLHSKPLKRLSSPTSIMLLNMPLGASRLAAFFIRYLLFLFLKAARLGIRRSVNFLVAALRTLRGADDLLRPAGLCWT